MKNLSDEELVRLYIDTQRNAYFERLYERYCDKVYRKCLSFTKDPVRAEDFTHDIFLKLIIKLGGFREQAKFST
jgi:DNA-directed RNA polymerase specialized sigma24 family protein